MVVVLLQYSYIDYYFADKTINNTYIILELKIKRKLMIYDHCIVKTKSYEQNFKA